MSYVENFPKDTTLIEEGTQDNKLFILARGRLGVYKGEVKIAEIEGRGSVVGELGVILNQPRTATIRTLEDCYLVAVDGTLDSLVESHPDIMKAVLVSLAEKVADTTENLFHIAHAEVKD
ncbi:MAG: cyclic nucleotide-binding domain-containing protein [Gammaproteobacteria bacterium]|jgi:CRP-like cAMP-binding protein|nr:cyclic nucleotide-binding domain-containing protein [Gammaproteobacteria bacterium]